MSTDSISPLWAGYTLVTLALGMGALWSAPLLWSDIGWLGWKLIMIAGAVTLTAVGSYLTRDLYVRYTTGGSET